MDLALRPRTSFPMLWRDTIAPREHGSWSLAFEPIVLALLVAPSVPGALLAIALTAVFFARRPWRLTWQEKRRERRTAALRSLFGCSGIALAAFGAAIGLGGAAWLAWLLPVAMAGGVFVFFDTQGAGREEAAEVAGAAAFSLAPAAFAALAGWESAAALALAIVATGRSVGSVLCVRAFLRAGKTKTRRDLPALAAAGVALAITIALVHAGRLPVFAAVAMTVFAIRSFVLLVAFRPAWPARKIGMMEAILGVAFVLGLAVSWNN